MRKGDKTVIHIRKGTNLLCVNDLGPSQMQRQCSKDRPKRGAGVRNSGQDAPRWWMSYTRLVLKFATHFQVSSDCKCRSGPRSIPSLCEIRSPEENWQPRRKKWWSQSKKRKSVAGKKTGGFFLLFFVKSYSLSVRFPCQTCPTTQQNSHVLLSLHGRCEWVAEFCALLSLTGSTGPDACCPFPDIERRRRHVWRFQVLCFAWFQMLKMTFGVVPHPTPKHTHTPQRTPSLHTYTHWSVKGCLRVLAGAKSGNIQKEKCDFCSKAWVGSCLFSILFHSSNGDPIS